MIQLDIRSRTKKFDSDSQCCQESDSDSTQKPPTPYDSNSATLLLTRLETGINVPVCLVP